MTLCYRLSSIQRSSRYPLSSYLPSSLIYEISCNALIPLSSLYSTTHTTSRWSECSTLYPDARITKRESMDGTFVTVQFPPITDPAKPSPHTSVTVTCVCMRSQSVSCRQRVDQSGVSWRHSMIITSME
jgi:hypothetical protein